MAKPKITKYKIGLVQLDSNADRERNLGRVADWAARAAAEKAALLALPEMAALVPDKNPATFAESLDGPTVGFLSNLARSLGLWIQGGSFIERRSDGPPWNTAVLIDPSGGLVSVYRKLHLFDLQPESGPGLRESKHFSPGREIVTAGTALGCLGFSICYDLRFPELYRLMALAGAELVFVPSNFTFPTGARHWESLLRARAIENACYVVAAAQCGNKPRYQAYGHSLAVGPNGDVLGCRPESEGLLLVDIDLDLVREARHLIPSLANRRSDVYRLERVSPGTD